MKTQTASKPEPDPAPRLPASGEVTSLTIDEAGLVAEASPGCIRLFERGLAEIVGAPADALLVGLERIGAAAEGTAELHARRAGNPSHVRVFWTRAGERLHLLVVNLERLQSPFSQSAQQARFGSLITHEMRNPLSSIKIVVQTLARSAAPDERIARRLNLAEREIRTLERVLAAVSDLTRQPPAGPELLDSQPLLEAAVAASAGELAAREVTVELTCGPDLPPIRAQAERLKGAVGQLVCEAARMRPGQRFTLSARADGNALSVVLEPAPQLAPREFGLCLLAVDAVLGEAGGRLEVDAAGARWCLQLPAACAAR